MKKELTLTKMRAILGASPTDSGAWAMWIDFYTKKLLSSNDNFDLCLQEFVKNINEMSEPELFLRGFKVETSDGQTED